MHFMPPIQVGPRLTTETYSPDGSPTLVRPDAERFGPGEHPDARIVSNLLNRAG